MAAILANNIKKCMTTCLFRHFCSTEKKENKIKCLPVKSTRDCKIEKVSSVLHSHSYCLPCSALGIERDGK